MKEFSRFWAAVLVAFSVMGGCTATTSSIRTRFSEERDCPESQVDVSNDSGNAYRASGCGKSAVYMCGAVAQMGDHSRDCVEDDAERARRPADHDRPALPPPDYRVPAP